MYSDTIIRYTRHDLVRRTNIKYKISIGKFIASVFAVATFPAHILIELHIVQGQTEAEFRKKKVCSFGKNKENHH